MENFERATKLKLRFESARGLLTVEDIWDLSLANLDTLAKAVNKRLKDEQEESFIPTARRGQTSELDLKLEILKHVIQVKVDEQEVRKARAERQAKLAQLKELAATKANEQIASKSLEDIQKMIAELESAE